MKKQLAIIALAALALSSCGGGSTQQNQENTIPEFTFVEPKENIAEKIWELLLEEDSDFGGEEEMDIDTASNTYKCIEYNMWSRYDDMNIHNFVELKCYQKNDSSWIGVVNKKIDETVEGSTRVIKTVYAVHYSQNKITPVDSTEIFPEIFFQIGNINQQSAFGVYYNFFNTRFETRSRYFWPIQFYWSGSKFVAVPSTPLMQNADDIQTGNFSYFDNKYSYFNINSQPDDKFVIGSDGVFKDSKGNAIAKIELNDGKVSGYYLLDSKLALAPECRDSVTGLPAAIGLPIKNVLSQINDSTLTKTQKDGKLVVTYRLKHDEFNLLDIFREYTAKDENSPIETIHVYTVPFTVNINEELEKWPSLLHETKNIFKAFNIMERINGLGKFKRLSGIGKNISVDFENGDYHFQFYPASQGGEYVLLIKTSSFEGADPGTAQWWYHSNGKFSPAEIAIPKLPYNDEAYQLSFDDDGLHYDNMMEKDFIFYEWNGSKFTNEEEDEEENVTSDNVFSGMFPSSTSSLSDVSEAYTEPVSAEGDLNQDGIKDYAIAIHGDGGGEYVGVYFGDGKGGGKLVAECANAKDVSSISITDKGVLRIQTIYEFESTTELTYMFRFQDGDFYLIGGKDEWSESEPISYNFLTNQKVEGKTTTTFPARNLKKLSKVKIGYFERGSKDNFLDD